MQKLTVMAASLLLVTALACSKSETVSTTSSETTATVATTTTATDTTTSTMPVTDTMATTGATDSAMSTAPVSSTQSTTTSTTSSRPAATSTTGSGGRGPVVTDTVAPNKRATLPGSKPSTGSTAPPSSTSTSSSPSSSTTTSSTAPPPMTSATSSDASLVAEGQSTFKSGCTACHGADGSGNTAMGKKNNIPDFRSATTQGRSDAELINIIQNGRGPVSSSAHKAKHLTNDQAKAVVAWIRSLK